MGDGQRALRPLVAEQRAREARRAQQLLELGSLAEGMSAAQLVRLLQHATTMCSTGS